MDEVGRELKPNIRTKMAQSSLPVRSEGEKIPRRKPVYPMSAERELARVALSVVEIIAKHMKPLIERVMAIYDVWADKNVRTDANWTMDDGIGDLLNEYDEIIGKDIDIVKLIRRVGRAGKVGQKISVRDWKSLVDDAISTPISEPFYMKTMDDLMDEWIADSVSYISSLPQTALGKVHEIIRWGYETNQPRINVYRRLEKVVGMTRNHARLIATDQMGTLNYHMTRYEHESLGVTHYRWTARHDTRVRPCHREYNNKIFSWNNPPADWYVTKSRGIVYTGNYFHPGQAINCRCTAKPVIDEEKAQAAIMAQRFNERSE